MPRHLCLTRHSPGIVTRIECMLHPLAGGQGLWMLFCAAGLNAVQPSAVKAQGPFHGASEAQGVLDEIVENLLRQGYQTVDEPAIWRLHLQAELRRQDAGRGHPPGHFRLQP
ncbi:hypothetical protein D3C81_980490 [compost metagenome]